MLRPWTRCQPHSNLHGCPCPVISVMMGCFRSVLTDLEAAPGHCGVAGRTVVHGLLQGSTGTAGPPLGRSRALSLVLTPLFLAGCLCEHIHTYWRSPISFFRHTATFRRPLLHPQVPQGTPNATLSEPNVESPPPSGSPHAEGRGHPVQPGPEISAGTQSTSFSLSPFFLYASSKPTPSLHCHCQSLGGWRHQVPRGRKTPSCLLGKHNERSDRTGHQLPSKEGRQAQTTPHCVREATS